uniref:Peroxisomal membrane protein MPV17 n=1 Tax=Haptolina brevifila TaxID=156173 RepID=A0A7S2FW45_9EUKA|eukprot:CAMPEP_0174704962 /NCGR_PEP_ID=MMETSP1094-20130205/8353_1 /TAXON_ID=156173 /ORGANISM="Chrysochromulina brevifilum, Strain UTEX LB 985" /LENGTH=323 /DNA_ID=CAMNT_0015903065 /DNA_START=31 /DNA_END=1002 /DNA_ORIENTATION=-
MTGLAVALMMGSLSYSLDAPAAMASSLSARRSRPPIALDAHAALHLPSIVGESAHWLTSMFSVQPPQPPPPKNVYEALVQYASLMSANAHGTHHALSGLHTQSPAAVPQLEVMLQSISKPYIASLEHHYFQTTSLQAFILVAMGDTMAQTIEARAGGIPYDAKRTLRMGMLGLLIGGLGTARWLQLLEHSVPGNGTPQLVAEKALLDACVWAPMANTAYLILTPLSEGKSPASVRQQLRDKFVPVMQTELATFLPYNLVSFSLVPPLIRPFTTGFISMCFAVYISWVTHQPGSGVHEAASPIPQPADVGLPPEQCSEALVSAA